jgi:hypothetical protein
MIAPGEIPVSREVSMVVRRAGLACLFALALAAGLTAYGSRAESGSQQYGAGKDSEYWPAVKACLAAWGPSHPFTDDSKLRFKVLAKTVKVFGVGSDISDDAETSDPQLILVQPGVNVMGKLTFHLMNPNGWYCFEKNVTVMAKSEITVACTTQVASAGPGATVMGSSPGKGGTTVMGKTTFERKCK